jgi:hypothetical protein
MSMPVSKAIYPTIRPEGTQREGAVTAVCCLIALAGLCVFIAGLIVTSRASNGDLSQRGIRIIEVGIGIFVSGLGAASLCRCKH